MTTHSITQKDKPAFSGAASTGGRAGFNFDLIRWMLKIDSKTAVLKNRKWSGRLGWSSNHSAIRRLIDYSGQQQGLFAAAVARWQSKNNLVVDGILGPKTWARMKRYLTPPSFGTNVEGNASSATVSPNTIPAGKLRIDTGVPELAKSKPVYSFTAEDLLWMGRFVSGEAGIRNDANGHAVLWAMFNRFGILRHKVSGWKSFQHYLRLYSTTLQPILRSKGAAQRVWRNHKKNPSKYPIVLGQGTYENSNVRKVQYKKHVDLQNKKWSEIHPNIRQMVTDIVQGKIPNPGIGIATEFASTRMYFKQKWGRWPNRVEWKQYTMDYASNRCKKGIRGCTWIGIRPNLDQMKNAFFIDNRFRNVPPDSVRIQFP